MFYGDIDNGEGMIAKEAVAAGAVSYEDLLKQLNQSKSSDTSQTFGIEVCQNCEECQPYGLLSYALGLLAFATIVPVLFGGTTRQTLKKKVLAKKTIPIIAKEGYKTNGAIIRKSESKKAGKSIKNLMTTNRKQPIGNKRINQDNDSLTINFN